MSREIVLNRIRERLGVLSGDGTRRNTVESRMQARMMNTVPAIEEALVDRFAEKAAAKGATLIRLNKADSVAAKIMEHLPVGAAVTLTNSVTSRAIDFGDANIVEWARRTSLENCVSDCYCAIAESGSLVIRSDMGNTLTHNFLADRHFVILPERDILASMEAVWQRVREDGGFPRDLTLVSGPSSTGDIEMRMENGVHGPRELFILLQGES